MSTFITEINNGFSSDPEENIFKGIWDEYESVVLRSLITSFGLDMFIHDQHGGDVDTIYNVRKIGKDPDMTYKNKKNKADYDNRGEYTKETKADYDSDSRFREINARYNRSKKDGTLVDAYTGKKVARNADIDLDHVISTKEIHDDPGRILAGLDGKDLANCEENLKPTDRSINRSMKEKDIDEYLNWLNAHKDERKKKIAQLKSKDVLSDKEKRLLNKLEKQEEIDPKLMKNVDKGARTPLEAKIFKKYYTSPKFMKDTAVAAGTRGMEMGARQAIGFVFVEIWMASKEELQAVPSNSELSTMIEAVGNGVKKGVERAKSKYKELLAKLGEGFISGALASLTTTICNIFFTTAKNIVRCIRQIYASVVEAGRILLFNPDNLMFGDRIKATTVILATGASVLAGTAVGELISKTPIGTIPGVGVFVRTFSSTLVSGLLSCTLLVFLDRSKLMNTIITELNRIPTEVNNYKEIADAFAQLAVKLENLDVAKFRAETNQYRAISAKIGQAETEEEINKILLSAYAALDIKIPWEGDFDSFMGNKSNHLVFS